MSFLHHRWQLAFVFAAGALLGNASRAGESRQTTEQSFRVAKGGEPILLPVMIEGNRYEFVLGTGTAKCMFDTQLKSLLGAPARPFDIITDDAPLPVGTQVFRAPPITLSGRPLNRVSEVLCVDLQSLRPYFGEAVAGVLGVDAVRDSIVRIDFDQGELSFLSAVPKDAGEPVPMFYFEGIPSVRIELKTGPEYFWLNTGLFMPFNGTLEARRFGRLEEAGLLSVAGDANSITALAAKPHARHRYGSLLHFDVAGFSHDRLVFGEGARSVLSLAYLSRFIVTFDFVNMQIYLAPGEHFRDPDLLDLSGLFLRGAVDAAIVASVAAGSAADAAGIQKGDAITEIDGCPVAGVGMRDIRSMFATPGRRAVAIRRDDKIMRFTLELRTANTIAK